ncbi:hypothetical protein L914_10675 [Phytophthora nicotianae]|uniref:Uncharacterized protein n=1 Tax=Phytophthora nicotianae TaxID=4792 RepID=W2N843_PHYNI|nr:hypothetical protein L914_10675 [Phytophthora nicotianae]
MATPTLRCDQSHYTVRIPPPVPIAFATTRPAQQWTVTNNHLRTEPVSIFRKATDLDYYPILPKISSLLKNSSTNGEPRNLQCRIDKETMEIRKRKLPRPLLNYEPGVIRSPRIVMATQQREGRSQEPRARCVSPSALDWDYHTPLSAARNMPTTVNIPTVSSDVYQDGRAATPVSRTEVTPPLSSTPVMHQGRSDIIERRPLYQHEIHTPAEIPVLPRYHETHSKRTNRTLKPHTYPVPVHYTRHEEEIETNTQKRRRVTPSPRHPLYESEYGLTVLETSKPLMHSRYPLSMRSISPGTDDPASRLRYIRSDSNDFDKVSASISIRYNEGEKGLRTTEIRAPRTAEDRESTSIATLVLKSKEFLNSSNLVRNRHDEIDWVATFLKVGFDSTSIYALMCPLRKGRWKSEEEKYTMGLLRLIENGTILLRHGQSIRGYIGEKLHSDDMRVLKKLSNCKMFHFAKLINPRLAEEEKLDLNVDGAQEKLDQLDLLKGEFLRSVQLEALVAVRKHLSDNSLRELLNTHDEYALYSCLLLWIKAFKRNVHLAFHLGFNCNILMKRAEGVIKSDEVDPSGLRRCTFTVQIDAAVEHGAFEAPGFRFRFLDGSRKQTSAIGSGHGWTRLQDNEASKSSECFRFEQSYPDVAVSESLAMAVDEDPILSFFLFDHPGLANTGTTPRTQGKEVKPSTAKAPAAAAPVPSLPVEFTPKAFAGIYEMDVSSLLSGALRIKQVWTGNVQSGNETQLPTQSLCLIPSTSGLKYLSIQVTVDQPLLTGGLLKKLNPITITIGTGRRLPGAVSQGIGTRSPHSPLHRYCKPAFALIHFFQDQLHSVATNSSTPRSRHSVPRLLLTPGQRQSDTIRWNSSLTLLCGRFNPLELIDAIRFGALTVEIRDRDLKQEGTLARFQLKWESLYTTGVDPGEQQQFNPITSRSTPRSDADPGSPAPTAAKPMDLPEVDEIARSDWRLMLANSGRLFPYGLGTFRLTELLNTAKQWMGGMQADSDRPYMTLKLTTDIISKKRRASPLGTATLSEESELPATVDLSPLEKVIREPGAYISTGASLSINVVLQSPIETVGTDSVGVQTTPIDTEIPSPEDAKTALKFSRMAVIIPYKDNATLGEVTKAMATVNLQALPGVPIRSYQMTESEKMDCETGALDVITGTQIIDSQYRMIIVEGLADKGMKYLHEQLQRKGPNDPVGYRMFCNEELRFTRRLYTVFEIDLKRIKLRYPLSVLMKTPDIYMRAKVSENCHQALARLADMRKIQRLIEVKHLDLFPTAQMLLEVESKYGESITLEDIHGTRNESSKSETNNTGERTSSQEEIKNPTGSTRHHTNKLKAPTDSTNASFEQSRRNRVDKNFLLERKKHAELLQAEYAERKQAEMLEDTLHGPVYLYSGQKLRTQDILQDKLREQLSKNRHATYTYSRDFQSLALSMVNPEALRQTEEQENRKKWTTQRGFIYPAPRQPSEYKKHPNAPSEARCEDLRQPFVDNINHPKPVSRDSSEPGSRKCPEFSTLPSKDMVFGGTNGDGTVNPDYFRSVHLCGEGLRLEMEEALKKEQDEWERRLVVDKKQLKFLAHGSICSQPRDKPSQLDKISDILRGPAHSKPIRIVKNATLPSGKRVPLEKTPVTIHNHEKYVGCVAATFASTLRPSDNNQFVATDALSGKPQDFLFPSTSNILTPPVKKFVTRKEIVPVRETEKRGLIWRNE